MAVRCMSRKCAKIVLWISVPVLVVSIIILILFPTVYKNQLKKDIAFVDGSLLTNIWEDIPLPIYEKLYFFNINNGEGFLKHGEPLNVTEVGPYTYSARWVKHNPVWNSNGTVSYKEIRTYQFERDLSVGSQDDVITTLNGPMIIAADILKTYNIAFRIAASFILKLQSEKIIIEKSVRELSYEGYEDPIIKIAPLFKKGLPFKNGRFMWLVDKNATDDGIFTVFTGENDQSRTNSINNWNGQERLNFWKGDSCNMMNGTNIEIGPPLPENPEAYTFFQTIFCRSLTFNYKGDETHFGIRAKRFKPGDDVFANGSDNPANSCFDLVDGRPSGVLDVRPCQFGAPVLLSFPHFYMADPSYRTNINGLNPSDEKHGSHLDVEPITGVTVDVQIRFQMNLQMSKVRGVLQFDDVPEGIFPVFWADLEIQLNDDWAHFFKSNLNNPKIIAYSVLGGLIIICSILIIISLVVLRLSKNDFDDDDPLIDVKEEHKENLDKKVIVPNYDSSGSYEKSKSSAGVSNKGLDLSSETKKAEMKDVEAAVPTIDPSTSEKS
ncbi:scavenger receptor class B member 1 [Nephila pilipes]|uniref:Scavenger receptor class B member 1 n=1 Tax=Nephila pilipes TaxID=299642 RepID=A0A8X6MD92_NEPPI|nr:scavenger receptor class B member 1 [Nephila pilipes]